MIRAFEVSWLALRRSSLFSTPAELALGNGRRPRIAVLTLLALLAIAESVSAQVQAKRLVALLDYLGSDYKNAVQDGKIISEDEFQEMQEFAKRSLELLVQPKKAEQGDKAGIEQDLKTLALQVENKADAKAVVALALWVQTTPLSIPEAIPVLGIYPTVETLTAQALMLCAFLATTVSMARERNKAR